MFRCLLRCSFYISLNGTYVGIGMISPHLINVSMLFGSIISWGIMRPYIRSKRGIWYDADLQETNLKSFSGYKVLPMIEYLLLDKKKKKTTSMMCIKNQSDFTLL